MHKTAHTFTSSTDVDTSLTVADLERHGRDWLFDCEYRQHSTRTIELRKFLTEKLVWFLREHGHERCGTSELKQFLVYIGNAHESPSGRWGNPRLRRAVRSVTVLDYFRVLRTFFGWLVKEGVLEVSPVSRIAPPVARSNQIQPFTSEQVGLLLQAARKSLHPRRDEAILLFLLDTGVRATELCELKMSQLDLDGRRCTVRGKGNKTRTVYLGRRTVKAVWNYLKEDPREDDEPVFVSDRGTRAGDPLTRSGLLQLIRRLGRAAGIQSARCSPHTFRHTFAVDLLRSGAHIFALQQLLGHTSLHMTNRYVALAQADIENQHRLHSPVDRLRTGK
ncbi:MAG TPA: tyrosine-type recombinase/integrase [Abditibacteriaceae bacterium]|jgi:integrase/recombinase XerC/integrase/recombinase XerD